MKLVPRLSFVSSTLKGRNRHGEVVSDVVIVCLRSFSSGGSIFVRQKLLRTGTSPRNIFQRRSWVALLAFCVVRISAVVLGSADSAVSDVEENMAERQEVVVETGREVGQVWVETRGTEQTEVVVASFLSFLFADSNLASCLPVLLAAEVYYRMLEAVSEGKIIL